MSDKSSIQMELVIVVLFLVLLGLFCFAVRFACIGNCGDVESSTSSKETNALKLFAADIDGTLINEYKPQPWKKGSKGYLLKSWLGRTDSVVAYITRETIEQVVETVEKYQLPRPDFIAVLNGSYIYEASDNGWTLISEPDANVYSDTGVDRPPKESPDVKACQSLLSALTGSSENTSGEWLPECLSPELSAKLSSLKQISIQEKRYQNNFKFSVQILDTERSEIDIMEDIEDELSILSMLGNNPYVLLVSRSRNRRTPRHCYVDLMTNGHSKGDAVRFLSKRLGLEPKNIFYAGDSGDDRDAFETLKNCRAFVGGRRSEWGTWFEKNSSDRYIGVVITDDTDVEGVIEGLKKCYFMSV